MQWISIWTVQNYWFTYNEQISIESVTQSVSNLAMQFGEDEEDAMVSSVVIFLIFNLHTESSVWNCFIDSRCGWKWTQTVCHLFFRYAYFISACSFHVDPSGTYMQYNAKAIGILTCSNNTVIKIFWYPGSGSEGAQTTLQEEYHKVGMCL